MHETAAELAAPQELPVDVGAPEGAELRRALLEIYVPRYGPSGSDSSTPASPTPAIDAERMFTFWMPAPA